tara:strand:+ start:349 stop:795 length:447 start_codon:yes stop_codon:yes gene_type:complete
MGYRSQVVLAVDEKIAPAFMAMLAKETEAHDLCFRDADEVITSYAEDGSFLFRWDHIKWYDSFPEIQAVEAFLHAANENDLQDYGEKTPPMVERLVWKDPVERTGQVKKMVEGTWDEHFRFLRIGEDNSDVEEYGYGFDIYMTRGIEY